MKTHTKYFSVSLLKDLLKLNDLYIDTTVTDKKIEDRFKMDIPQDKIYIVETPEGILVANSKSSIIINTLFNLYGKLGSTLADRKLMQHNLTAVVLYPGEDIKKFFKLVE